MSTKTKLASRERRRGRIRKKIRGTEERPRLVVFRSLRHIYAQLVNDSTHKTLLTVSDLSPEVKAQIKAKDSKIDHSAVVGKALAEKALSHKIENVVFDRGGFRYHGRIKALADAAREAGLQF